MLSTPVAAPVGARADGVNPDTVTGADDRPGSGKAVGATAGKEHAPRRLGQNPGFEQRLHDVPLRRGLGGTDEKAGLDFSGAERRGALGATPVVDEFGELGVVA